MLMWEKNVNWKQTYPYNPTLLLCSFFLGFWKIIKAAMINQYTQTTSVTMKLGDWLNDKYQDSPPSYVTNHEIS